MRRTKSWMLGWLLAAGWWPVVGWGQGGREVTIAADDTLMVQVLNGEELSREWRVASSGELNLPLVGRVKVAGLTVGECEQLLAERLRRYQHNPQVTVYVQEFRSHPVSVVGAVDKPGVYQLKRHTTLFDAIVLAGGPKEAGPTVTLTRAEEAGAIGHPQARRKLGEGGRSSMELVVDLKDFMSGRGAEAELEVYPEDVVAVSVVKQVRMVHLSGEVNRPGSVELVQAPTMSLVKLVALAGGLTRSASPGRTMIVHVNEDGVQTSAAFVDLRKVMRGKAKDLELMPGDVVIVPANTFLSYLQTVSIPAVSTGMLLLGRF
ncbi:MAG: polysaccharide biosynthesis/export family protein [Acidobacteriota bacterium]